MNEIAKMAVLLGLDTSEYSRGLTAAEKKTEESSKKIKDAFKGAFGLIAGAATTAITGLSGLAIASAKTSADIGKMSDSIGISAGFLSQYNHILGMNDISLDQFGSSVLELQKNLISGFAGNDKVLDSLQSLGLSMNDLNNITKEQQFELVAEKISLMEDSAKRAQATNDLFGTSSKELTAVLSLSKSELKELTGQADKFGKTISDLEANQAQDLYDQIDLITGRFTGLSTELSTEVTPAITETFKIFGEFLDQLLGSDTSFQFVTDGIAGLYAGILSIELALSTIGEAFGLFVAVGVRAFELPGEALDIFLKRIQRGGLIIASVFDDVADQAQHELAQEIAEMENLLGKAFDGFSAETGDGLDEFFKKTKEGFNGVVAGFDRISKAGTKAGSNLKTKFNEPVKEVIKTSIELEKQLRKALIDIFKEAEQILGDFAGLVEDFQTPMEELNAEFVEQVRIIGAYKIANEDNNEALAEADKLLKLVLGDYQRNKKIIEDTLPPFEQLIKDINEEIEARKEGGDAVDRLIAKRELEAMGIAATTLEIDKYISKMAEANALDGTFGNGVNSFEQLLSVSLDSGDFFKEFKAGFKNLFGQGGGNTIEGFGSIADFGSSIIGLYEQTRGQDDAGRILQTVQSIASTGVLGPVAQAVAQIAGFVNQLTGGSLFGTSYKVTGGESEINIGQGGATGTNRTFESRRRSLFRGTQRRTTENDIDAGAQDAIDELFQNLNEILMNSALAVGDELADSLNLVTGQFIQEFDKDGNLTSELSTVLGRTYSEGFEEFAQRLTGENILAGLSNIFPDVSQMAEMFRPTADGLLEFAQFALQAGADIQSGAGLMAELQGVFNVINDSSIQLSGETLLETYTRVSDSTRLFESVLSEMGSALDLTRVEFVRFAADITTAAGGVEAAADLWNRYFGVFYSAEELAENQLNSATGNRDELLGEIGLDSSVTVDDFRQMFENILPDLSADAIVNWLAAADAIGDVIDAESSLADIRGQNAQELETLMAGINESLARMGLSDFALQLRDITQAFNANITSARRLGATEQQLAQIQVQANNQIQQALQLLEGDISNGIDSLYGTQLDQINEQIAALESQGQAAGNLNQINQQRYENEIKAIQNIQGFLDNLLLNRTLSPLNPQEQLSEAMSQFEAMFALAQGGDIDALNALPGLADTLLGLGRDVFASGPEYTALFDSVTGMLSQLEPGDSPESVMIGQNQQLIDLQNQRLELERTTNLGERLLAVTALAEQIGMLTSVTGESFGDLAERLGLPIEQFLGDLGVSVDDLTVETTVAMADVANLLGIELIELADSVGFSLGSLADQNSLINDALEQTIQELPFGFQSELQPLLSQLEATTDPAVQEELLAQFVEIAEGLPQAERDLLAPFFEQIDPITEAQAQLNEMISMNSSNDNIVTELQSGAEQRQELNDNLTGAIDQLRADQTSTTNAIFALINVIQATGSPGN